MHSIYSILSKLCGMTVAGRRQKIKLSDWPRFQDFSQPIKEL
jgi:hypothetical protein